MGCDGGTIPRRDELVRVKKRPEQVGSESLQSSLGVARFFIEISARMLDTWDYGKCI